MAPPMTVDFIAPLSFSTFLVGAQPSRRDPSSQPAAGAKCAKHYHIHREAQSRQTHRYASDACRSSGTD